MWEYDDDWRGQRSQQDEEEEPDNILCEECNLYMQFQRIEDSSGQLPEGRFYQEWQVWKCLKCGKKSLILHYAE